MLKDPARAEAHVVVLMDIEHETPEATELPGGPWETILRSIIQKEVTVKPVRPMNFFKVTAAASIIVAVSIGIWMYVARNATDPSQNTVVALR